jgi:orotidine-5'-phosphate decarboxylase
MAESFGRRLWAAVEDRGGLCVGVDPSPEVVAHFEREDSLESVELVALRLVEAASSTASVVKLQVAFFERFGSRGYAVLERVIAEARAAGLLVIADAKRGDIGSSNEGYAATWLDEGSPLASDAVTVSPYLGVDSLEPFRRRCQRGRGLFVLAATSNPEGRSLQGARTAEGVRVFDDVLARVATWNEGADGVGGAGVVLGASAPRGEFALRELRGPVLVPGVGAQGGGLDQVRRLLEGVDRRSIVVSLSRALVESGTSPRHLVSSMSRWRDALSENL